MSSDLIELDNVPLVFAADQALFHSGPDRLRFCVLQPLMTLAGERVDATVADFPNRGRVWWMLRDDIRDEQVVAGSVWVGTLEPAKQWNPQDSKNDKFQVRRGDVKAAPPELVEIVRMPAGEPDVSVLRESFRLPWPRPTTTQVVLRGQQFILGPVRATWLPATHELEFAAVNTVAPEVLRVPVAAFDERVRQHHFEVILNQSDIRASAEPIQLCLTRADWLKLEQLRAAGQTLDASTDAQIVGWAAKQCKLSRDRRQKVQDLFVQIAELSATQSEEQALRKLARLADLQLESERAFALGAEAARLLAETPVFEALVREHLDEIVARQVQSRVDERRAEIQNAVKAEEKQRAAIRSDIQRLTQEYQRKTAAAEHELQAKLAERRAELERREAAVAEREQNAAEQERQREERLERVIARYQTEAEQLGDQLLAQLPFLQKLGLAGGMHAANGRGDREFNRSRGEPADAADSESVPPTAADSAPAPLLLPALRFDRQAGAAREPMAESTFIDQFKRLVAGRGFQFDELDLLNLHVCAKVGGLTVLAGPTGTGKSSLPRLYAEALGCGPAYLHVAVRPDWLDDRDFVGAFNPLARRFEPANSGVVEHLIAASLEQRSASGPLFLVCLDEMNLARVEHYFAQFLSILEQPADERRISLFAAGLDSPDDPYGPYRQLSIGDNVRFFGAVNIDDTTHFFSPKVLDRAQVIGFSPPDLRCVTAVDHSSAVPGIVPVSLANYQSWIQPPEPSGAARDFVLQLAELLANSRISLGARQFLRVMQYVAGARGLMSDDTALDYQIKQVVLPRIRRTAPRCDETVELLRQRLPSERFPRSAQLLARMAEPGLENDYFQLL